jgi:hypothetical protein
MSGFLKAVSRVAMYGVDFGLLVGKTSMRSRTPDMC